MTAAAEASRTERRAGDVARLGVGGVGVLLAGLWAQASTTVDTNVFKVVNDLPNSLEGLADALNALGSIWCVVAIVVVLLVARWFPAARDAAVAGAGAWLIAIGLNDLVGSRSASSLGIIVRTGSGPTFPSASTAVITALTLALVPYLVRPLRRLAMFLVILVALSAMYLGTGLASDVVGGLFLGLAAGASVHVAFGALSGRPSVVQIQSALSELGFDVTDLELVNMQYPGATIMDGSVASGGVIRVLAFGSDQRDGQIAAKLWHNVMYKDPGLPVFGSRLQTVEHLAYASLLAESAGVAAPRVHKTGSGGPDIALLVSEVPTGRSLSELGDRLTDDALAATWAELDRLHGAGITHGNLGPERVLVDPYGRVTFADLGSAEVTTDEYRRNRDVAALLVTTMLLDHDDERAIRSAITVLGKDRVGAAVPLIQPAALPPGAGHGTKHFAKTLKQLRKQTATAAGVEDAAPLKIHRLSLVNIGIAAGVLFAVGIAIHALANVNWASLQKEFSQAVWGWAVLAAVLYPLIPLAWATAITGAVNVDLPFVPTVAMQLGATFLSLITPNGIGGNALQIDYLHHEDATIAAATSAVVLNVATGGVLQLALLVTAAARSASTLNFGHNGTAALGIIALVAAAVGVIMFIPKVRGKVVPALQQAITNISTVIRDPHKALKLLGGNLTAILLYPALLGLCLLAFGQSLGFAQLIVVQLGAGLLAAAAPVPGGIGVQEAALTAGLTGFGVPTNPALAAVIVFRAITFAIPPIFGYFAVRWLRREGYA